MTNFLFLHAHPDDEAIFTGGTISKLTDDGHEVHVVFATGGELGASKADQILSEVRMDESRDAGEILGVSSINFLGYHDSGLDKNNYPKNAFAACDVDEASQHLLIFLKEYEIDVLICDDEYGIYGHPDHVKANEVGVAANKAFPLRAFYFSTVDREYLHFVETHLVEEANKSRISTVELARDTVGMSTVEITHTLDVNDSIETKRQSMAAHASQINDTSSALTLDDAQFKAVYGYEWFICEFSDFDEDILKCYCK